MNRSSLNTQPEALIHAEWLEKSLTIGAKEAAAELRRLHEVEEEVFWLKDKLADECRLAAIAEALLTYEQQHTRDAEAELNCAEEVLDGYAAHLELKETAFNCIGDYIKEVCEALKEQPAQQEQIDRTSVRSSGPCM